jgi:bacterial/archaeal transporter family-2 protein
MQTRVLFILMALCLGAVLPIQAAINARLARTVGSPITAAFVLYAVGSPGRLFISKNSPALAYSANENI